MHIEPHESSNKSFGRAVLSASFVRQSGQVWFSKAELAKYPELLYEAATRARASLDTAVNSLCVLATSGIPFGCVLSQELCVPVHFFRRQGWRVSVGLKEAELSIVPPVTPNTSPLLVDSHVRTGGTASACCYALAQEVKDTAALVIVTLVGLDHLVREAVSLPVHEVPIVRITDHEEFLASLFRSDREDLFARHLAIESGVWQYGTRYAKIGQRRRVRGYLRNIADAPETNPEPEVLNIELARKLRAFPKLGTDLGVWDLFGMPLLLREIGRSVAATLDWSRYDALVGTCAIGSALAWVLAYYAGFTGPVLSCYESPRIVPPAGKSLTGKRILVVQGRVITAQDTEEVISRVKQVGGRCQDVLAMWWAPETGRKRRCAPLRRLFQDGIRFIVLGGL